MSRNQLDSCIKVLNMSDNLYKPTSSKWFAPVCYYLCIRTSDLFTHASRRSGASLQKAEWHTSDTLSITFPFTSRSSSQYLHSVVGQCRVHRLWQFDEPLVGSNLSVCSLRLQTPCLLWAGVPLSGLVCHTHLHTHSVMHSWHKECMLLSLMK